MKLKSKLMFVASLTLMPLSPNLASADEFNNCLVWEFQQTKNNNSKTIGVKGLGFLHFHTRYASVNGNINVEFNSNGYANLSSMKCIQRDISRRTYLDEMTKKMNDFLSAANLTVVKEMDELRIQNATMKKEIDSLKKQLEELSAIK